MAFNVSHLKVVWGLYPPNFEENQKTPLPLRARAWRGRKTQW